MQKKILELENFLTEHYVGSISTSRNNTPDIAIIFFVYIDQKLYFKSRVMSHHSENIVDQPLSAFACYSHDSDYSKKYGIQAHGKIQRVLDEALMKHIVSLYSEKFPGSWAKLPSMRNLCSQDISSTFYEFDIHSFKIIDEWWDGNHTMLEYLNIVWMLYTSPPLHFSADLECVGCIIEHNRKILTLQNRDDKLEWGRWGSAAGRVEKWENHYEGMLREVFEETGLDISAANPTFFHTMYCEQAHHSVVYHLYHCKLEKLPHIEISHEHTALQWIKPEEALKLNLMEDEDTCIKMVFGL